MAGHLPVRDRHGQWVRWRFWHRRRLEALDHVPFDEENFDEELMVSGPSAANIIQHIWTERGALNWVAHA